MAAAVTPAQLDERLDQAHRPYHQAIAEQLSLLLDRFGCALLHRLPFDAAAAEGRAPIVFGDCRGRTADAWLSREAVEIARTLRVRGRAQRSVRRRPRDRAPRRSPPAGSMRSSWRSTAAAISMSTAGAGPRLRPGRSVRSKRSQSSLAKRCSAASSRRPPNRSD